MRRVELLDYARFVAALAVVAYHYLFKCIQEGKITGYSYFGVPTEIAKYGYLGVELFFIISGYVIFHSARGKTPGAFAASRAIRLYPAFWVAVIFSSLVIAFVGVSGHTVTFGQVMANMTMVPGPLGYRLVDGVYWTLAYELKFYVLVMLLSFVGLGASLWKFFLLWPWVMLVAWLVGLGKYHYLGGYYAFFAAGALFALLKESPSRLGFASLGVSLFLCVSWSLKGVARAAAAPEPIFFSSAVVAGVVVLLFAFFFLLNTHRGSTMVLPASGLLGALTYPVYLLHSVVGIVLLSTFADEGNAALMVPLVVLFVLGLAYTVHVLVERELAGFWREFFQRFVAQPVDWAQGRWVGAQQAAHPTGVTGPAGVEVMKKRS